MIQIDGNDDEVDRTRSPIETSSYKRGSRDTNRRQITSPQSTSVYHDATHKANLHKEDEHDDRGSWGLLYKSGR